MNTLETTARGTTLDAFRVTVGTYIWHRGAFRLVTAVNGSTIRMGRYALHTAISDTVEVAS